VGRHAPETQSDISAAYNSIGCELKAIVVPVGAVWERFLGNHDHPILHDRDQSHPTLAGSYLAACVFFSVLFQEPPVGIGLAGLSEEEESLLQKFAWQESKRIHKPKGRNG
jgi:hypothetical protein